jgi:hypothetical protein
VLVLDDMWTTGEALADRRPPTDEIGPDTAVMTLVQVHLDRIAEDGRSPATQETYMSVAANLRINSAGSALPR